MVKFPGKIRHQFKNGVQLQDSCIYIKTLITIHSPLLKQGTLVTVAKM